MNKLHLGCGGVKLEGWINIDLKRTKAADLRWNLLRPLPYDNNTAELIFCEHVFEHFTFAEGRRLLADWYRLLAPGGRVRIGVPGLEGTIKKYQTGSWRNRKYGKSARRWKRATGAEYFNACFYMWGHKFIYDEETLKKVMRQAGFKNVKHQPYGKSYRCPELCGLETRPAVETTLIVEGEK